MKLSMSIHISIMELTHELDFVAILLMTVSDNDTQYYDQIKRKNMKFNKNNISIRN